MMNNKDLRLEECLENHWVKYDPKNRKPQCIRPFAGDTLKIISTKRPLITERESRNSIVWRTIFVEGKLSLDHNGFLTEDDKDTKKGHALLIIAGTNDDLGFDLDKEGKNHVLTTQNAVVVGYV